MPLVFYCVKMLKKKRHINKDIYQMHLIFSIGKEVIIYDGQGPQETTDFKKYNQNFNQIRSPFLFPPIVS